MHYRRRVVAQGAVKVLRNRGAVVGNCIETQDADAVPGVDVIVVGDDIDVEGCFFVGADARRVEGEIIHLPDAAGNARIGTCAMGIAGGDNNIQPVNTGEIEIDPGRCFQAKVDGQAVHQHAIVVAVKAENMGIV